MGITLVGYSFPIKIYLYKNAALQVSSLQITFGTQYGKGEGQEINFLKKIAMEWF